MHLQCRNNSHPAKLNTSCSQSCWHFAFCRGSREEVGKQPFTLSCSKEVACSCELEEGSSGLEKIPLRASRLRQLQQPLLLRLPWEPRGLCTGGNRGAGTLVSTHKRVHPAPSCPGLPQRGQILPGGGFARAAELAPQAPRLLRALFNGEVISQRCLKLP